MRAPLLQLMHLSRDVLQAAQLPRLPQGYCHGLPESPCGEPAEPLRAGLARAKGSFTREGARQLHPREALQRLRAMALPAQRRSSLQGGPRAPTQPLDGIAARTLSNNCRCRRTGEQRASGVLLGGGSWARAEPEQEDAEGAGADGDSALLLGHAAGALDSVRRYLPHVLEAAAPRRQRHALPQHREARQGREHQPHVVEQVRSQSRREPPHPLPSPPRRRLGAHPRLRHRLALLLAR
mmetsp:Transcript_17357/g.42099  ORF Transcript_17357/g.42099 Transcript_17357/m.42099 type:complete len:238 (+) Transcript_17357:750-1463(+)